MDDVVATTALPQDVVAVLDDLRQLNDDYDAPRALRDAARDVLIAHGAMARTREEELEIEIAELKRLLADVNAAAARNRSERDQLRGEYERIQQVNITRGQQINDLRSRVDELKNKQAALQLYGDDDDLQMVMGLAEKLNVNAVIAPIPVPTDEEEPDAGTEPTTD